MRVVVVGAGLGGLSAAAHLVRRGHDVTVIERGSVPGGRVGIVAEQGFRLDTGPTLVTMPELLAETFAAAGAEITRYVTLDDVDPVSRAVFADGSMLRIHHDREAMTEEIRRFANAREAGAYNEFREWLDELMAVEVPNFVDVNYDGVWSMVRRWRAGVELIRLGGLSRLDSKVASFFADDRLQRVFSVHPLFAGLAPHDAFALYSIATYMETIGRVCTPRGGMHTVPVGLARAVAAGGATIRYDSPVTRILRSGDNSVTGVEIGGSERFAADAVVCNVDLPVAYRTLLGGIDAPRAARRGKFTPSCLLWVAGVDGAAPEDATHLNLHFGDQWDEAFKSVIKRGMRMSDPSIQVTIASVTDPSLAPAGAATLAALEPVPNLDGRVDWARTGSRLADDLRRRVAQLGYPTGVVVERMLDPLDWEANGYERGTPFGLSHTIRQAGPMRPSNVERRVPGLFFAGASTIPGVGVPMVLMSGRLAARRVEHYAARTAVVRW